MTVRSVVFVLMLVIVCAGILIVLLLIRLLNGTGAGGIYGLCGLCGCGHRELGGLGLAAFEHFHDAENAYTE